MTRSASAALRSVRYRVAWRYAIAIALLVVAAACGARGPTTPRPPRFAVSVMGPPRLTADQIVAWFHGRQPRPNGVYAATEPVESLARYFLEEGIAEGVAGDVAFMQSVVETGWFRFAGLVPASSNNFAGLGATDSAPGPAVFADARMGVRAQIQHLRAYADPAAVTCTVPPLANPCADPRFHLVVPKGRAPTWNQMGNGNWASASTYAASILSLYDEAKAFNGIR